MTENVQIAQVGVPWCLESEALRLSRLEKTVSKEEDELRLTFSAFIEAAMMAQVLANFFKCGAPEAQDQTKDHFLYSWRSIHGKALRDDEIYPVTSDHLSRLLGAHASANKVDRLWEVATKELSLLLQSADVDESDSVEDGQKRKLLNQVIAEQIVSACNFEAECALNYVEQLSAVQCVEVSLSSLCTYLEKLLTAKTTSPLNESGEKIADLYTLPEFTDVRKKARFWTTTIRTNPYNSELFCEEYSKIESRILTYLSLRSVFSDLQVKGLCIDYINCRSQHSTVKQLVEESLCQIPEVRIATLQDKRAIHTVIRRIDQSPSMNSSTYRDTSATPPPLPEPFLKESIVECVDEEGVLRLYTSIHEGELRTAWTTIDA